ncbi:MAG: dipeptide epimerase [Hyphomicrobiales bacterium]|nr:dipeptide epimerase [Hyphomicrobiales bacterium]
MKELPEFIAENPVAIDLAVEIEHFRLARPFVIARGARTHASVVTVSLRRGGVCGRGECVPYARYGESIEGVVAAIAAQRAALRQGMDRASLQRAMPAGAARNALDCALWDLTAKEAGCRAWEIAGLAAPAPTITAFTLSLGTPEAMAAQAAHEAARPLLKLKLGGHGDAARLHAVRAAAPQAELIVDANESWDEAVLDENFAACLACGVTLVEQPLPAGKDGVLADLPRHIRLCADESVHDRHGLASLRRRYDMINVKLDKTGGLTEALALIDAARQLGFGIFVGCMVASSLGIAPAMMLTGAADYVDLDAPLLLGEDRVPAMACAQSLLQPPVAALWG